MHKYQGWYNIYEGSKVSKKLEESTDAWATEFVQTNLRSHLASLLRELDSLFPKELPFGTSRVGRSCFTAMAITENYQSTPYTDRDLANSVISWFLEGECSLSLLFVLHTTNFVEGKKNDYTPSYSHFFIVNLVGVGQEK